MRLSRWFVVLVGFGVACWLAEPAAGDDKEKEKGKDVKVPKGWAAYEPTEKDFTVVAPAELDDNAVDKRKEESVRKYYWKQGDALLSLTYHADRKGEALKDDSRTLKLLALDNRIIKGTLKDIKLDNVPGVEYAWKDDGVTSTFRVYRSADGSKAVNMAIRNSDKLTAEERTAFFESFKFTKPKK